MNAPLLLMLVLSQGPSGHGPPVVGGHGSVQVVTNPVEESRSAVHVYATRPNNGFPLLQVVGPNGAPVQVYLGSQRVTSETLPVSLRVAPEMFYTVQVQLTPELSFQKKVQVHAGMMGTLEVWRPADCQVQEPPRPRPHHGDGRREDWREDRRDDRRDDQRDDRRDEPPPQWGPPIPTQPPAPQAMDDTRFEALVRAIRAEAHESRKLALVESALQHNRLYTGQVGALVDLFSFGDGRVGVARAARGRIVDAENLFVLYEHFRFDSEKEQARRVLEGN